MHPIIVLLHGLGGRTLSLVGIEAYLTWVGGFERIVKIEYPAATATFVSCLESVDEQLAALANRTTDELIVVGQSMGGVVAHKGMARALARDHWLASPRRVDVDHVERHAVPACQ